MAQGITAVAPSPYLYWLPRALAARADPSVPLYWVPGQEDALTGDEKKLACVALPGWGKWLDDAGTPIADLDQIDHRRIQYVVPGSSVWVRPDLVQAVYAFGQELRDRGATVLAVKLPPTQGPAAFLAAGGTLEGIEEQDLFIKLTDRVFKHAHKALQKDKNRPPVDGLMAMKHAKTQRLFHPAQDVVDNVLYYGFMIGPDVFFLTSERQLLSLAQLPAGLRPRHTDPGPGPARHEAVIAWVEKAEGDRGSVAGALDALRDWVLARIVFRDTRKALAVATWIFGTWLHQGFAVYPYLVVRSPEKDCGKTTLLDLFAKIAFNADASETLPTASNIYRGADANAGTQLFDEVKLDDSERFEALGSVLNVGYRHGSVVKRSEKQGDGRFKQVRLHVYAPRVLSGLTTLNDTLEDRSIFLALVRKLDSEDVTPFRERAVAKEAGPLQDRCLWAAMSAVDAIFQAYETTADPVLANVGMKNRAADLWQPLIAICQVADAEDGGTTRVDALLALVREQQRLRASAATEAGTTVAFVQALQTVLHGQFVYGKTTDEAQARIRPTDLLERLRAPGSGFPFIESARKLASMMKPLGFVAGSTMIDGVKGIRAYTIRRKDLVELLERFAPKLEAVADSATDPDPDDP